MSSAIIRTIVLLAGFVLLLVVIIISWLSGKEGTLYKALQKRLWNSDDNK